MLILCGESRCWQSWLGSSTLICSPSFFNPFHCSPSFFNPLRCSPSFFNPLHCCPPLCNPFHCSPSFFNPLHCSPPIFKPFHCSPLLCSTLLCPPLLSLPIQSPSLRSARQDWHVYYRLIVWWSSWVMIARSTFTSKRQNLIGHIRVAFCFSHESFARGLVLKQRHKVTRKWAIAMGNTLRKFRIWSALLRFIF